MCELMFPKPTRKKKRKHHPAPIVDTVKGECFLCRLEGIRRQQYTEEHHVFYGGGLRQVSEENGFKAYLCPAHHKDGPRAYITAERPESCYVGYSNGSTKKPIREKNSER
mgnify:CR=1 FL=1